MKEVGKRVLLPWGVLWVKIVGMWRKVVRRIYDDCY